jgi:RHS repeat-associated protein
MDYEYDYRNQMVSSIDQGSGQEFHYRYDALGRRIETFDPNEDVSDFDRRYIYSGWRVIEERDLSDAVVAEYVYGRWLDEPVAMRRNTDGVAGMETFYYHQDDQYNVTAILDGAGNLVERYEYDDYGVATMYTGSGSLLTTGSLISNPYLWNGRRYDSYTGLYYYRTRYLDPTVGRFTTQDTIGIWGDVSNLGNGRAYVGNSPWTYIDPFGLDDCEGQSRPGGEGAPPCPGASEDRPSNVKPTPPSPPNNPRKCDRVWVILFKDNDDRERACKIAIRREEGRPGKSKMIYANSVGTFHKAIKKICNEYDQIDEVNIISHGGPGTLNPDPSQTGNNPQDFDSNKLGDLNDPLPKGGGINEGTFIRFFVCKFSMDNPDTHGVDDWDGSRPGGGKNLGSNIGSNWSNYFNGATVTGNTGNVAFDNMLMGLGDWRNYPPEPPKIPRDPHKIYETPPGHDPWSPPYGP